VLIATQLCAEHWFYLYIVWFAPLVLFALFAGLSVGLWAWLRRTHERGLSMAVS